MFKLSMKAEFTHNVPVSLPCDNGFETHELRTRFRALTKEETARYSVVSTPDEQIEFLNAAVVRFEDVVDDDGKPITDAEAVKRQLLDQAAVRLALALHYNQAMVGGRRGN